MLRPIQPARITPAAATGLRRAPLVLPLTGLAGGILLDRLTAAPGAIYLLLAAVTWGAVLWAWRRQRWRTASLLLLVSTALAGAAWHHLHWRLYASDEVALSTGEVRTPVVIELVARHAPRHVPAPPPNPLQAMQLPERSRFEAVAIRLREGRSWRPASGKLLVIADGRVTGVQSGDRLQVSGTLSLTQPAINPGDIDFYTSARAQRRLALVRVGSPAAIRRLQAGSPWTLARGLDWLRQQGNALLWRHVGQRQAGLAAALLLGAREQLDRETTDAFVRTNTIHLLAISGMHIAILAATLFYALKLGLLPRLLALTGVAGATVLYTVVTDADPSAVRAMIVVLLVCLAMALGRGAAALNGWAAGGLLVLAINPCDLFRAGPQLSFLAVAVMAWFWARWSRDDDPDPLDELIASTRPWHVRVLRGIVRWHLRMTLLSVAIWLVTMPIVGSQFHAVAPAAILLSVVLSLPVSVALMSGFAVMILGGICPFLGDSFGWLCGVSLRMIDAAVHGSLDLPGSFFWFAGFPHWWSVGWYVGLAALLLWSRVGWRKPAMAIALWSLIGTVACWRSESANALRCTFLSVGHGVAVVIELPDGQTVLYDAGRLGSPTVGARSIAGYLWHQRIRRLDAVILSHADLDHYNALPELLEQFAVGRVYVSPQMFRDSIPPLALLDQAIEQSCAERRTVSAGDAIVVSRDVSMQVLHPPATGLTGNDNAHSIVIALEYDGRRILLTGDLESTGMQHLLAQPPYDCDIALAPHHGSTTGSSHPAAFRSWSQPEWLVISGSATDDQRGLLPNLYQPYGATVLHTAHDGAVQFTVTSAGIEAAHWSQGRWQAIALE